MNIQFEEDGGCYYAIAEKEIYNGQVCDTLWYAEIEPKNNLHFVRWDDNFKKLIPFDTLKAAKEHILAEAFRHVPQIVGNRYDL